MRGPTRRPCRHHPSAPSRRLMTGTAGPSPSRPRPVALSAASLGSLPPEVGRPAYDRTKVAASIVHFGVGGFHRAHQAMYVDGLMNDGLPLDWGICGVG